MKKIFTLITGLFMAIAVMAADRGPSVTISSSKNYKILVDGKSYFGSQATIRIAHLLPGVHAIEVYEMRTGLFSRNEKLVSSSAFKIRNRDVAISVDKFGRISIQKSKTGNQFNKKWNNKGKQKSRDAKQKPSAGKAPAHRF